MVWGMKQDGTLYLALLRREATNEVDRLTWEIIRWVSPAGLSYLGYSWCHQNGMSVRFTEIVKFIELDEAVTKLGLDTP